MLGLCRLFARAERRPNRSGRRQALPRRADHRTSRPAATTPRSAVLRWSNASCLGLAPVSQPLEVECSPSEGARRSARSFHQLRSTGDFLEETERGLHEAPFISTCCTWASSKIVVVTQAGRIARVTS